MREIAGVDRAMITRAADSDKRIEDRQLTARRYTPYAESDRAMLTPKRMPRITGETEIALPGMRIADDAEAFVGQQVKKGETPYRDETSGRLIKPVPRLAMRTGILADIRTDSDEPVILIDAGLSEANRRIVIDRAAHQIAQKPGVAPSIQKVFMPAVTEQQVRADIPKATQQISNIAPETLIAAFGVVDAGQAHLNDAIRFGQSNPEFLLKPLRDGLGEFLSRRKRQTNVRNHVVRKHLRFCHEVIMKW